MSAGRSTDDMLRLEEHRLAWRETGDETVVLDLQGSVYFSLNPTGALLWGLLARGATREELVSTLVEDHAADLEHVRADVDRFLGALREADLLSAPDAHH